MQTKINKTCKCIDVKTNIKQQFNEKNEKWHLEPERYTNTNYYVTCKQL